MRYGFVIKVTIAVALVALFDRLFGQGIAGAGVGAFAGAWLAGVVAARRDVRGNRAAVLAALAAGAFVAALVDDPGPLAWVLFWCALSLAALLPRAAAVDDAWRWGVRLVLHALTGVAQPVGDLGRVWRGRRAGRVGPRAIAATLALPLLGGALFLVLFAAANPVIEAALAAIEPPSIWRVLMWSIVAAGLWPSLRPHVAVMRLAGRLPDPEPRLPGTSLPSVLVALAVFNALFAVQNVIDIVVLWSGGPLPAGMTQTEYVHRGAYPLIVTAIVAGVMALAMLRPGSDSARHPWARRMVVLWVAQNLILVASSVWRTIDYVETSMLTEWRIAALAWMALVALGLATIAWRIVAGRSARWLINVNAAAALVVLTPCAFLDLGAVAASWNVRHQAPTAIDLCYLNGVGDGALLPLIALERRPMDAATRERVHYVRELLLGRLDARQSHWATWTPRGARRLDRARVALGPAFHPIWPVDGDDGRTCDGALVGPISTARP